MKIYTKRGDKGKTDLFGGGQTSKANLRVKCYGLIDSSNAFIGYAISESSSNKHIKNILHNIAKKLFVIGSEVATAQNEKAKETLKKYLPDLISEQDIKMLETFIDEIEEKNSPLKTFILPIGCELSARLHLARAKVRECELALIALDEQEPVRDEIKIFFNRLSDLLFVMARYANTSTGFKDEPWP